MPQEFGNGTNQSMHDVAVCWQPAPHCQTRDAICQQAWARLAQGQTTLVFQWVYPGVFPEQLAVEVICCRMRIHLDIGVAAPQVQDRGHCLAKKCKTHCKQQRATNHPESHQDMIHRATKTWPREPPRHDPESYQDMAQRATEAWPREPPRHGPTTE